MRSVAMVSGPSVQKCIGIVLSVVLLIFALSLGCLPSFAQGNAGRILGAVTDQTGGAIAGAKVAILDIARGTTRTLTADQSGEYNAPNLLPSTYDVSATFQGFKTAERSGVILEVNQDLRVDLTLQPGEQAQRITVTEALPMVDATNAELGGTLQNQIISDLPLNGRNFANLLQLRPGVTIYPGGSGWTQSTNGQRAHDNVYLFEGINGSDPWMAQPIITAVMAGGDAGTLLSIDAIDEFKTEENPRAEYGWKPGAIVNVAVKSGTNAMHGSGFAYGRDGAWDALNYFETAGPNGGVTQPAPPFALEQFGATLGGPILKDKLFYFGSYEGQRYTIGNTNQLQDPITAGGVGSAVTNLIQGCLSVPAGQRAPLSLQLAGLTPQCAAAANYPGLFPIVSGASGVNFANTLVGHNQIDSGVGKINYHLSDQHALSFLYEISPGTDVADDGTQTSPIWLTDEYARSQVFASNWTWTPNSTWVNEFRVGYSHYFQQFLSADHSQNPADYDFNGSTYNAYFGQTNPFYFGFPSITVVPFTGTLGASWPKVVGPDGVLQILDHVSYLRGKHAFKFGFELLDNKSTSNVTMNGKGTITFGSLTDFFSGVPDSSIDNVGGGAATILVGNLLRHFSDAGYAAFAQDDWRIKPRLTLNLGLRYEINTVPVEQNNLQGTFSPTQGLVQIGSSGFQSAYNGDHRGFAPRLGVAWDMFGNGKTVLRAAGGIIYEQLSLDVLNGIGNSFGMRTQPTGDTLCGSGTCTPGPGNIAVANVSFSGAPLDGASPAPASFTGAAPGSFAYNWGNNSSSVPVFNFITACGDGNTVLPGSAGFKPPQCAAIWVDPNLRSPYVENWSLDIQRALAHNLSLDVGYVGNHGVKLLGALDLNQDPLQSINVPGVGNVVTGPGWTATSLGNCAAATTLAALKAACKPSAALEQAGRPFASKFPYLNYIDYFGNLDTSSYNGLQVVLTARNFHGLTLTGGYTYSHALGESSDQGTSGGLVIPANSYGCFSCQLYSSTAFDIRNRGTISGSYTVPGRKGLGHILEGWTIASSAVIQSGTPWGVNDTTTDFAGTGENLRGNPQANEGNQWDFFGSPSAFEALHDFTNVTPGPTGVAGVPFYPGGGSLAAPTANATCNQKAASMGPLATASLAVLGCYALGGSVLIPPAYGSYGTMARNPWRDQGFRDWDASITKKFQFKERFSAEFRAEFFNLLNHVNFTNPFGGPGGGGGSLNPSSAGKGAGFAYVTTTPDIASSNPIGSGGPREIQLGLKLLF